MPRALGIALHMAIQQWWDVHEREANEYRKVRRTCSSWPEQNGDDMVRAGEGNNDGTSLSQCLQHAREGPHPICSLVLVVVVVVLNLKEPSGKLRMDWLQWTDGYNCWWNWTHRQEWGGITLCPTQRGSPGTTVAQSSPSSRQSGAAAIGRLPIGNEGTAINWVSSWGLPFFFSLFFLSLADGLLTVFSPLLVTNPGLVLMDDDDIADDDQSKGKQHPFPCEWPLNLEHV